MKKATEENEDYAWIKIRNAMKDETGELIRKQKNRCQQKKQKKRNRRK